jgi:signal peptidase I
MEPTLNSGGLLIIEPVNAEDVQVGDIIVYDVPTMVRDYYNYPAIVAHRVIAVSTSPSLSFRTKGDNTGEDPFTIRPQDIKGTVGKQIPYLGLPLLFFQSQQGLIFTIIGLVLLSIFLYGNELGRGGSTLHRGIFSPIINEEKRSNRLLTRKIEATEKKMDTTEQALEKFSAAISEYAQHLASHTSAIQGLAEASHELRKSAAEQNKVLAYMMKGMEPSEVNIEELTSRMSTSAREAAKPAAETPKAEKKPAPKATEPAATSKSTPPGCARQRTTAAKREEHQKKPATRKPRYQV